MIRVLFIDNYDSFTWNLVHLLGEVGVTCEVVKNDELTLDEAEAASAASSGLFVSPGPGTPDDAGIVLPLLSRSAGKIPIFGVCLGLQAIGQALGGLVVRAERRMHGRTSPIFHQGAGVFEGLPSPLVATRYHSLVVLRSSIPPEVELTAWTEEGDVMGLRHRTLDVEGLQFHPESFLTTSGKELLSRWAARLGEGARP